MAVLIGDSIDSVDLSVPAGKVKNVPLDHYMLDTAQAMGTSLGV
jgi:6-phosphofructokinase 1